MRSHPYTPPAPLPPLLGDLATDIAAILPNQPSAPASENSIELDPLDPDTSRLIPARKRRHHVRVQGKLVVVRSMSTANLRSGPSSPRPPMPASPVAGVAERRMSNLSGGSGGSNTKGKLEEAVGSGRNRRRSLDEMDEEVREVVRRDRQLRGYGIGGAGNIRRPTDVANFSTDKRRWNLREKLGLVAPKAKSKESE
ncbi:hypothetical protein OQA88_11616 [Cercophora sp. LCS_1]